MQKMSVYRDRFLRFLQCHHANLREGLLRTREVVYATQAPDSAGWAGILEEFTKITTPGCKNFYFDLSRGMNHEGSLMDLLSRPSVDDLVKHLTDTDQRYFIGLSGVTSLYRLSPNTDAGRKAIKTLNQLSEIDRQPSGRLAVVLTGPTPLIYLLYRQENPGGYWFPPGFVDVADGELK